MIEAQDNRFVLKNAYFEYVMGIDGDNKLYHAGFLPSQICGRIDCAAQRERLLYPYPFEVLVNVNFEPLQTTHGVRYFWPLSSYRAVYDDYAIEKLPNGERLRITLLDGQVDMLIHLYYELYDDSPALRRYTSVENRSGHDIVVNHISSFVLSNFPYFSGPGDPNDLYLHSFKSHWSWEGKHEVSSFDSLGLFKKWCRNGYTVENTSSWSCQSHIPYFVIEERDSGLFWGMQIEHSGCWRFETGSADIGYENWFYAQGGMGNDRHAHWYKTLKPGERFVCPPCSVTTAKGTINDIYNNLHTHQEKALVRHSLLDESLPVIYNDWQYMYGGVNEGRILEQLNTLKACGVECYVIDAGWFTVADEDDPASSWWDMAGDWEYDRERFPNGLARVAGEISDQGMIPGIWCEIEAVGRLSKLYNQEGLLQKRGDFFVEDINRRFLYFGSKEVRDYADAVFERLIGYGFRYFKIDYNIDNAPGCTNADDSLGQGLHQHRMGYYQWLEGLRERHPEIIVESCSSGGMRLEYGMLSRTDLASITDQESNKYTGNILFQVSKLIHPSQCGNWSALKENLDLEEYAATLINAMMGRMHISGNILKSTPEKQALLKSAIDFYKRYRHIIKNPAVYYHTPDVNYEDNDKIIAFEYRNRENTTSVFCAMRLSAREDLLEVRLKGLKEGVYEISAYPGGKIFRETSENLRDAGLKITFPRVYTSRLLLIELVSP